MRVDVEADAVGDARAVVVGRAVAARRERILRAMVEVAGERGFEHVSVRLLTARAGVSTRTFYEEFEDLRDCFLAVLDLALERAGGLIAQAFAREERWQDGVLGALASLLSFFDSEPVLARVWFVEAMAAGSWALARREEIVAQLRAGMIEHWATRGEQAPDPVAATGVMASVLGLIQTQLVTERPEPLIELLGPSMGFVTSLYLDKEDVKREVERGEALAREIRAGRSSIQAPWATRAVSAGVAIPAALGLLVKRAGAPGHPNAWSATPAGEGVALALASGDRRAVGAITNSRNKTLNAGQSE